ncbi:MAG: NAD-dependent epimerase/dehydratase family protein [Longimicrobiales bacterium]
MRTRRRFLQDVAATGGLLSLSGLGRHAYAHLLPPRTGAPLRILILGGTGYIGPHLVHVASQRGHSISMLNRGRREPSLFESDYKNVEAIQGDRATATGYDNLKGKTWDVVIETSGQQLPWTRDAVKALKGSVGRYQYVSSTGVFLPYHTVDIPENGPIVLKDEPPREQPSYGVMKALSENEVRAGFGDNAIIIRPGYIVGPGDTSDRWTYWPVRVARGGEIMVPGKKTDPVQYVDVRDLAEWMILLLENGTNGTFNVVGPGRKQTMEEFVYGLGAITPVPLSWTWIEDYEWLKKYPWRRTQSGEPIGLSYAVPWIMAEGDNRGHMQISNRRALAAGLKYRPLAVTARDTADWRLSPDVPQPIRDQPRYVLTAEQETAMLQAWKAR